MAGVRGRGDARNDDRDSDDESGDNDSAHAHEAGTTGGGTERLGFPAAWR
jgi:hypothetical protein